VTAGNFARVHGVLFCKPHFKQLFKSKGNYDEGFGHETRKREWMREHGGATAATTADVDQGDHQQPVDVDANAAQPATAKVHVRNNNIDNDSTVPDEVVAVPSPNAASSEASLTKAPLGKLVVDTSFLEGSGPTAQATPDNKPTRPVSKLVLDTSFLAGGGSSPSTAEKEARAVGKLRDPHGFLVSPPPPADDDTNSETARRKVEVGKLAVDRHTSFLAGSSGTPPAAAERPRSKVGKLDMSAFGSPAEPAVDVTSPKSATPGKLAIGGVFSSSIGDDSSGVSVGAGALVACTACDKKVFPMERVSIDGDVFHKWCLKCTECKKVLTPGTYARVHGVLYCKPHFKQLFKTKVCLL
jgi:hypothetical protein